MEFAVKYNINIVLAYYPPYRSKYNPIERVRGALEKHIMTIYETALYRPKEIGKWFIIIEPTKCNEVLNKEIKV
jgi:transposase